MGQGRKAARRGAAVRGDSESELPPQCRQWRRFWWGHEQFDRARDEPNQWHEVYDLRPLEYLAAFLGLYRPHRPAMTLMYHTDSGKYLAYPLALMPARVKSRAVRPWEAAWHTLPWRIWLLPERAWRAWQKLERALARASDRIGNWLSAPAEG